MNPYFFAKIWRINEHSNPERKLHQHAHHELFYCLRGRGVHDYAGGPSFTVQRGTLALFPARMPHNSTCSVRQAFDCSVVSFHSALFSGKDDADRMATQLLSKLIDLCQKQPELKLPTAARRACAISVKTLVDEFSRRPPGYELQLKAHLSRLLVEITRGTAPLNVELPAASATRTYIEDACHYIDAHYMEPLRVEDFLSWIPLSRSRLHAHFKQVTGQTLVERITKVRIRHAQELLTETDRSVTEVALSSGFLTLGNFYRAFRAVTGQTPSEVRSQARSQNRG